MDEIITEEVYSEIFYAHYDKLANIKQLLFEHLLATADAIQAIPPNVAFPTLTNAELKELCRSINVFHDIGKYTVWFQNYLLKDEGYCVSNENDALRKHAHVSACFQYLYMIEPSCRITEKIWPFLAYLTIRFHHCSLTTAGLFKYIKWDILQKQAINIIAKTEQIYEEFLIRTNITRERFVACKDIRLMQNDKQFPYMPKHLISDKYRSDQWYFALIYLFSLLIDADKLDSAGIKRKNVKYVFDRMVTDYIGKKHTNKQSELIEKRNTARNEILSTLDCLSDQEIKDKRFYIISAPTGIGKTLASLQCVLRLQERIRCIENYVPRIITAIPFINIIEQTKIDYQSILGDELDLVVHHRLADFNEQVQKSNDEGCLETTLLCVEAWEGDVILTTFVQLFQSLLTGNNKLLKKVNKIAGSIVILDEVQAVPQKYMPIIGAILRKVADYYGVRFVLMTATQPKLLEWGSKLIDKPITSAGVVNLFPNSDQYFECLKRTRLIPDLQIRMTIEEFGDYFLERYNSSSSAVIVVNTIKQSIQIYQYLKKIQSEKQSENLHQTVQIRYLSTNIIPKHRREVISKIKAELKKGIPVILVSTQTIEAGVDLDFDMGFRCLAPLESLIQTAGRVNREGVKRDYCPVYIFNLIGGNGVYDQEHLEATKTILSQYSKETEVIYENIYHKMSEEYYNFLLDGVISDESRDLWENGVMSLNFEKLKEFQLIQNIGEVVDVFIEWDNEATDLANIYEQLMSEREIKVELLAHIFDKGIVKDHIDNKYLRKRLIKMILAKMSNYIVSIRIGRIINNRPIDFCARNGVGAKMYWVPPSEKEKYYNQKTGFVDESGNAFV